jgi:hypothetical protein
MSFLISKLKKSVSIYLSNPVPKSELEIVETEVVEEENANDYDEDIEHVEPTEKVEYEYIDEDDLSQKFGIDRDLGKNYKLDVCIYKINNKLEKPFVEYYFEKATGSYTFIESELTSVMFESIKPEETIPLDKEDGVDSDKIKDNEEEVEIEPDEKAKAEEEEKAKAEEEEKAKAEEEEKAKAEEEEKAKAEEEEKAKAEEEEKAKAE